MRAVAAKTAARAKRVRRLGGSAAVLFVCATGIAILSVGADATPSAEIGFVVDDVQAARGVESVQSRIRL